MKTYLILDHENWKVQTLPLARIKKIMKSEEFIMQELEQERRIQMGHAPQVKPQLKFMISAEAPLLMSKACELLIQDISARSWQHTARNRRRTLQKQDVHAAVGESEEYDFLIDIVPRVASTTTSAEPPRFGSMDGLSTEQAHMPPSPYHFTQQQQQQQPPPQQQQPHTSVTNGTMHAVAASGDLLHHHHHLDTMAATINNNNNTDHMNNFFGYLPNGNFDPQHQQQLLPPHELQQASQWARTGP
jgi:histone H3/H4